MDQVFAKLTVYKDGADGRQGLSEANVKFIPYVTIKGVKSNPDGGSDVVVQEAPGEVKETLKCYETPSQVEASMERFAANPNNPIHIATGLTALGANQGAALALTKYFNEVDGGTTGTGDGVKLPAATPGKVVVIQNSNAFALDVWPSTGESVEGLANNANATLAAGATKHFYCKEAGKWLSASAQ